MNKQKTSKIYLMVLRRPGVLEGLPGKVVCSRLLARIDPVLFPMPYLTTASFDQSDSLFRTCTRMHFT